MKKNIKKYNYGTQSVGYTGLQKLPPVKVNSGADIAMAAGQGAATGAAAGAVIGPWGAVIGGAVGGIAGGVSSATERQSQRSDKNKADHYNNDVDYMNMFSHTHDMTQALQARDGMNVKNQIPIEVEGDGSGDPVNGYGEILLNPNLSFQSTAAGGRTHEQGGEPRFVKKGTKVIPVSSKDEHDKILGHVRRFTMTNDKVSKAFLKNTIDKLPTDEEAAEIQDTRKYRDGTKGVAPYEQGQSSDEISNNLFGGSYVSNSQIQMTPSPIETAQQDPYQYYNNHDKAFNYKVNHGTGEVFVQTKVNSDPNQWKRLNDKDQEGNPLVNNNKAYRSVVGRDWESPLSSIQSKGVQTPQASSNVVNSIPQATPPVIGLIKGDMNSYSTEADAPGEGPVDKNIQNHDNPLNYANTIYNLGMGASPATQVQRTYFNPEEYKYADTTQTSRRAALENRNFETQQGRGIGISRGQYQGIRNQIGVGYNKQIQDINERAYGQQQNISNENVNLRNQATHGNIQMKNIYDDMDRQNLAAKQSFTGAGIHEATQYAGIRDQKRYMMQKDNREFDRDARWIKNARGEYHHLDKNGNTVLNENADTFLEEEDDDSKPKKKKRNGSK